MRYRRVRIVVEVNLDPVPGMFHELQDHADQLRDQLEHQYPWYQPTVSAAEEITA